MIKENGGPAFPFVQTDELSGQLVNGWGSEGMTLRDYFAAKALNGLCADGSTAGTKKDDLVAECYELADAMILERDR